MICLNCGKAIDDDLKVCPFCGSLTEAYDDAPVYEDGMQNAASEAPAAEPEADPGDGQDYFDENPVYPETRETDRKPAVKLPSASGLPALVLSALACVLSLICLLTLGSVRRALSEQNTALNDSIASVEKSIKSVNSKLGDLNETLAKVQSEAYNQFASQSIAITKDITPLTGPVEAGKNNVMFIVNAKGNLRVNTSFDWQKYNSATGGWVSIDFSGSASTNEEFGLRLENQFDPKENTYTSKLWAQGITRAASGTYRCVITDDTGITKTSAEATVSVA